MAKKTEQQVRYILELTVKKQVTDVTTDDYNPETVYKVHSPTEMHRVVVTLPTVEDVIKFATGTLSLIEET